eukprot:m.380788 g.380788  ORF g.380788 m.380788 type:complete len:62 (+) comp108942_c0_seq1:107-292(+)
MSCMTLYQNNSLLEGQTMLLGSFALMLVNKPTNSSVALRILQQELCLSVLTFCNVLFLFPN